MRRNGPPRHETSGLACPSNGTKPSAATWWGHCPARLPLPAAGSLPLRSTGFRLLLVLLFLLLIVVVWHPLCVLLLLGLLL